SCLRPPYISLRICPKGIPKHGNWKVRQLLVFSPSGAPVQLDPKSITTSPSRDGGGPPNVLSGQGSWASADGSGDTSWLAILSKGINASTIVVRSYPQEQHAPTAIVLEGSTDGENYTPICTEDIVQQGTACWDCIINF
ncbi:hypothetical protein DIPPA_13069, partial [Diplonema papillatum]